MSKKCHFNKVWLDPKVSPEFVDWLDEDPKDTTVAYCKMCCKQINLSNMGKQALVSHAKGPKHMKILEIKKKQPLITLFQNKERADSKPSTSSTSSAATTTSTIIAEPLVPKTAYDFSFNDNAVTSAEIIWAVEVIYDKLSLNSCDRTSAAFKRMFTDSKIALGYTLGKTKAAYVINHGIAPYLRTALLDLIKECKFYVVAFDESLNKVSQKCQMDLVIRFWNTDLDKVESRYWTSVFMGRSTAEHLLTSFLEGLSQLDLNKLLQVSMDGPNVNHSFLKKLKTELLNENNSLIDIGVCGLHTVSGAVKTGHNKAGWKVYAVLRTMYNYLKDSPARRALYTAITGGTEFPLKFTSIRWLENGPCLDRALKIFDKIIEFVENESVPVSENKKTLQTLMKNPLLKAQLASTRSVINECEPFLRRFQGNKPLAPFLHAALSGLVRSLMAKIVKTKELQAISDEKIKDLDMKDSKNLLATENISIGFEAKRLLKDAKCTDKDRLLFKSDFRKFIIAVIDKLLEKSPIKSRFVRGLSCFDPNKLKNHQTVAIKNVEIVLETLHEARKISGITADNAQKQFILLASAAQSSLIENFDNYKDDTIGLDEFYNCLIGEKKEFQDIWSVMKICFIISHGNASVEGGFSINKSLLVENLEESLVSQRIIYDTIKNVGGPENFQIKQDLIKSVRSSRRRYQDKLKEKKDMMSEEEKRKAEKRKIGQQLKEIEEKKKKLQLQREKENVELETLERALQIKKRQI